MAGHPGGLPAEDPQQTDRQQLVRLGAPLLGVEPVGLGERGGHPLVTLGVGVQPVVVPQRRVRGELLDHGYA